MRRHLEGLSQALGVEITKHDLLDLEETDRLFDTFKAEFQKALQGKLTSTRKVIKPADFEKAEKDMQQFSRHVHEESGTVFCGKFEDCGALSVAAKLAVNKSVSLLRFDGDSVNLLAADGSQGFALDSYDETDGISTLELIVWGNDWNSAFLGRALTSIH